MTETYQHRFVGGEDCSLPAGKIVCVGRNYAAHARELNNPVPKQPLLFIKPPSAYANLEPSIQIPEGRGRCHHELEIAVLIGDYLTAATQEECGRAIAGVGLALDLTLRDLQDTLKEKGHPWERSKAFDGSAPISAFVTADKLDLTGLRFQLERNGQLIQDGHTADMLFPVLALLEEISKNFSLWPGDVVLTGTPAGVGELCKGDQLKLRLEGLMELTTSVV